MSEGAIRVVLLAREGQARERLGEALRGDDLELVATFDPAAADEAGITAASPQAILVALEPAIEDAVERLDAVLSNPALNVLFEEADLVVRREGWEAARWRRHLSAKLHRHDDVLPPGPEPDGDWLPSPGPLPGPADVADLDGAIAAFADEAGQHVDEVASDRAFDGLEPPPEAALSPFDPVAFEADGGVVDVGDADFSGLALEGMTLTVEFDGGREEAASTADSPAQGATDAADVPEAVDFGGLSLADPDAPPAESADRPPAQLDALDERIAGLSLADPDSYGFGTLRGAVLVEAGLGGPDAVRQLLSALPDGFPRAILLRMQLDATRSRRLAKQMERVTDLIVEVARKGGTVVPGQIYFLPPEIGVVADRAQLVFVSASDAGPVLDVLPPGDSAVLLLSGADRALADALAAAAWSGALVAGQSAEESYDPAAALALAGRGGTTGTAAELAALLVERWPPADHPPPSASEEELAP